MKQIEKIVLYFKDGTSKEMNPVWLKKIKELLEIARLMIAV